MGRRKRDPEAIYDENVNYDELVDRKSISYTNWWFKIFEIVKKSL